MGAGNDRPHATLSPSQSEALEESFKRFRFKVGKRAWRREDLHERTICNKDPRN